MREQIAQMQQSLDSLLGQRRVGFSGSLLGAATGSETIATTSPNDKNTAASSALCDREDNMRMAMTRDNSVEPATNSEAAVNGPVTVEEPMGSLYEVTRLRNIRSNRAKKIRPRPASQEELDDFISRGVISEPEAQDLYNTYVPLCRLFGITENIDNRKVPYITESLPLGGAGADTFELFICEEVI